jgi:hypothetical protein
VFRAAAGFDFAALLLTGLVDLLADFAAGFAAVLAAVFAGALLPVPRLLPDDAAMAGL